MLILPQDKRLVLGDGPLSAKICLVGEAPGADEDRLGKPFVGNAGNLLDQLLHNAGIARGECYITNVIKERPKNNVIDPFYTEKKGFTQAGRDYVSLLREELRECGANVFIPMGNVSLAALTDLKSVSKWRGSILESTLLPGRKVIPTIHPAAALYEYLFRYPIIYDLRRARREAGFPDIRRVKRNLIIDPSFEQAMYYLEWFKKEKRQLSFDIEIVNQELSCLGYAWTPTDAICIPQTKWTEQEERHIWVATADVLEDREIPKLGQNLMFDTTFLMQKSHIITRGRLDDTMVGHHITYPDFPKGLDFLCSIYATEPYYKDEGKIWKNPNMSNEQFWLYNAKDAAITMECWVQIEKEMEKHGTRPSYEFTMSIFPILQYMQLRGIKADRGKLADAKVKVVEKTGLLQAELDKMVGVPFNAASSKQCQEYFYIKKGIKPYVNRKTGNVTCDDKAMTRIARKGYREAYLVQEIRGLRKLSSTYLDIEFDADSRLRCSYNPSGTTTGRLSSSQTIFGTGANFQNIPPEFKGFLVADDGMVLVELDKRQAEWVVVAYLCGDANMIEVVEKGFDAHCRTAKLMLGAPEDLIKREDKVVGKTTDEFLIKQIREEQIPEVLQYNPFTSMSMRQGGKKSNHSFNYDLSPNGFSMQYTVELAEAKRIYALYHKAYPSIKLWHQRVVEQLRKDRTLRTCLGRVRIFLDRWSDDLFKAAYAFEPQSTVADSLNYGLRDIYADQQGEMGLVDALGQVHDSFLFQFPVAKLEDLAKAIIKMDTYLSPRLSARGRDFRLFTDIKLGFNWHDMGEIKTIGTDVSLLRDKMKEEIEKLKH